MSAELTRNQEIATVILQQIGGNKFKVMTGAKNIFAINNGLSFRLPSNFAQDGINHVQVVLNGKDLYDVTFNRIRGTKVTLVAEANDVYAEDLQAIFTRITGLNTRL